MPIVHAIVLGIVQGLTEFLPVSSSGHLALVPWLFDWNDFDDDEVAKAFDVAVHMGTLVAVAWYFRRDLRGYVVDGVRAAFDRGNASDAGRTAWLLVLASVPAGVVGFALNDALDRLDDEIWLVAAMLIVFGLVLAAADRMPGPRQAVDFRVRDALAMGLGQAAALQPGVSRSGVTMSVARGLGFDRDGAARLSFLMSLPVIAGAGVFQLVDVGGFGGIPADLRWPFAVGVATSAVTGWLAVWGTLRLVRTRTFAPFVLYRVAVGAAVLGLLASSFR